ncbi:5-methyltetrahydropteroyltriglutamate--homocysteine methyltransferase-like [Glandiceps talaboti]
MPLLTTVIGSYPKPENLKTPDWFKIPHHEYAATMYSEFCGKMSAEELEKEVTVAMKEVIDEQIEDGIDVITDGEIRRENYIFHLCRHLEGFDLKNLILKAFRNGALTARLPRITGKVVDPTDGDDWAAQEWREAQNMSSVPVKYTIPGPMTIIGSTHNEYYEDVKELSADLFKVVNKQIIGLVKAGCRHIQLDEPVMVRNPEIAMDYGIEHASKCFEGVGPEVTKAVHVCCGYPMYLDQKGYQKAERKVYFQLADKLDSAGFDEISIEDAHQHNDLSLLQHFQKSKVIFGAIKIADSSIETTEEIRDRLKEALRHIPADRLIVAPDCGLGHLPHSILRQKVRNMVRAAKSLP